MNAPLPSFAVNREHAALADLADRITKTGAYKGKLIRAEYIVSQQKTEGIEFTFEADDQRKADYLTLWLKNSDGKELRGRKVLDALLVIFKLKGVRAQQATIRKYDHAAKQDANFEAVIFPELMGKPIGVVLQREGYYPTGSNQIKWKVSLWTVFEHATNRLAKEVLDNAPQGEALVEVVASLQERPAAVQEPRQPASASGRRRDPDAGNWVDQLPDDDIPF